MFCTSTIIDDEALLKIKVEIKNIYLFDVGKVSYYQTMFTNNYDN
jgi:hypothetical protein